MGLPISGFTRLKSLFKGGLNLSNYDDVLKVALNAEVGTLPKDMLAKILAGTKGCAPIDKIALAKKGFTEAITPLNHGIEVNQRAQSLFIHKFLSKLMSKEKLISLEILDDINIEQLSQLGKSTQSSKMLGIEEASLGLTKTFSQIFPDCAKVNVASLNSGSFGAGFKLEFLDASGNKILHDKVLKIFYGEGMTGFDVLEKNIPAWSKSVENLCSNISKRDIVTLFNNIKSKLNGLTDEQILEFLKPYEAELAKNNLTQKQILEALGNAKNMKLKDLKALFSLLDNVKSSKSLTEGKSILKLMKKNMESYHGVAAEANTSTFIRNRLGHSLSKTDVIAPDFYDLKRGYSIAEFSDEMLPKSNSNVDFSLLGLIHTDLHNGNKVASKIIDIGGIQISDSRLQDKLTLRIFKKIVNQKNPKCREEYILRLNQEMEQMNFLDREKVRSAIEIAKSKIAC